MPPASNTRRRRRAQNLYGTCTNNACSTPSAQSTPPPSLQSRGLALLHLRVPEPIRKRIEIEANSASARTVKEGCVVPAIGFVRESVGFVQREVLVKKEVQSNRHAAHAGKGSPRGDLNHRSSGRERGRGGGGCDGDDDDDDDDDETNGSSYQGSVDDCDYMHDNGAANPITAGRSTPVRSGSTGRAAGNADADADADADVNASIERREREERLKGGHNRLMPDRFPGEAEPPDAKSHWAKADGRASVLAHSNKLVPISQLERAMGELVLQDGLMDKLQAELVEVRLDRDELQAEVTLLREQKEIVACGEALDVAQQMQIEKLMDEVERLNAAVAEKDDEIQQNEFYQNRQKRQEEGIRRLESALADATKENVTTLRGGDPQGLLISDTDGDGVRDEIASVLTAYTHRPQERQTAVANSVAETRPGSAPALDDLQYREKAEEELATCTKRLEKELTSRLHVTDSSIRIVGTSPEIGLLRAELDRSMTLLGVAEEGLNEAKAQIQTLQEENEDLRLTASLVEKEINVSVDQDAFLRSEVEALQQLLAETEKEAKEATAHSAGNLLSPREEELEEQFSNLKQQMMRSEETLQALQEENNSMKGELACAEQDRKAASSLSVTSVSLQTQVTSLKFRLADQGRQLTSLEMLASEKAEVESTLRAAIDVLRRQVAVLRRQVGPNASAVDDINDPPQRNDADDILQPEMDYLEELLASVSLDGSRGERASCIMEDDEGNEIKHELEERLHRSESARLDAEGKLVTAQEDLQRERANAGKVRQENMEINAEKMELEERLTENVRSAELLRSEVASIREHLHCAGIKIIESTLPQKQNKRVKWFNSEPVEAKEIMERSDNAISGYAAEISELKRLLGKVLEQGKKEHEAGYTSSADSISSKELNEISNEKLLKASSDLRTLIKIRTKMETLSRSIKENCQAVLRLYDERKEGRYMAPADEIMSSFNTLL